MSEIATGSIIAEEQPKDFNLHINHPELGRFIITRKDNYSLGFHELDELVNYIKQQCGIDHTEKQCDNDGGKPSSG